MPRRDVLARRRRACGYTQESLAFELQVDVTTVARWERGLTSPQPWQRRRLATALDVSQHELDQALRVGDDAVEGGASVAVGGAHAHWGGDVVRAVADTGTRGTWAAQVDSTVRVEVAAGRQFAGQSLDARVLPAVDDGRILVVVPEGVRAQPLLAQPGRGALIGVVEGTDAPYVIDVRRARRRLAKLDHTAPLVAPRAFRLDDLTAGILWAAVNLDAALSSDDSSITDHRRRLRPLESSPRSVVQADAAEDVFPVSQMWLGSEFCARHVLRYVDELGFEPPLFWTQEQRGEEASGWLLFAHKHGYLQALARRYAGAHMTRVFCVPEQAVTGSPAAERILLLLAAALMESYGIETVLSAAPEYGATAGFALDRRRRAIVATWVGTDGLWQVDVTDARPTVSEFVDAGRHAQATSVMAGPSPGSRLRAMGDYLQLDWPWLVERCAEIGDYGAAGIVEPTSRLLSAAGVERACQFVGELPAAA